MRAWRFLSNAHARAALIGDFTENSVKIGGGDFTTNLSVQFLCGDFTENSVQIGAGDFYFSVQIGAGV